MAIKIVSAVYGTTNSQVDVTGICQQMVDNGNDDITVDNTTMGGDPDVGVVKSFAIIYQVPGAPNPGCYRTMITTARTTIDLV